MSSVPGAVYVSLDSLLDSRLGTLALNWPDVFRKCVRDESYQMRVEDDFTKWGGPNREEFAEAYAKRDLDTLASSIVTAVPGLVKNLMQIQERDFEETPYFSSIGLDVNIWPYEMDDFDINQLKMIARVFSGINVEPNIIRRSIKDLTPTYITGRYRVLIMYDFRDWLQSQIPMRAMLMHRVTVMAPWMLYADPMTPEQLSEAGLRPDADQRLMRETALREYMNLEHWPTAFFSMLREDLIERILGPAPEVESQPEGTPVTVRPEFNNPIPTNLNPDPTA